MLLYSATSNWLWYRLGLCDNQKFIPIIDNTVITGVDSKATKRFYKLQAKLMNKTVNVIVQLYSYYTAHLLLANISVDVLSLLLVLLQNWPSLAGNPQ